MLTWKTLGMSHANDSIMLIILCDFLGGKTLVTLTEKSYVALINFESVLFRGIKHPLPPTFRVFLPFLFCFVVCVVPPRPRTATPCTVITDWKDVKSFVNDYDLWTDIAACPSFTKVFLRFFLYPIV